jgi:transposase
LTQDGEIVLHRHMRAGPAPFLTAIAPDREDLVVAVEGLVTGYGLADLCTPEGLPFIWGPALSMKAIHGGQATHDTIDAQKIAGRLRGGMLPQASGYPAARRATRDWLRRRRHLMRQRAAWLAHLPQTNRQDNLPERGNKLADNANREGVATRWPDPAVQQSIDVDLTLLDAYDRWRTARERARVRPAQDQDAQTVSRLRSIPGIGTLLALVLRYESHAIRRVPRVQDFVA